MEAQLWAQQMRYLYGCGDWSLDDPKEPSEAVLALVIQQISHKLIEAGLYQHGLLNRAYSRNLSDLLGDVVLSDSSRSPLFDLRFATDYQLVGVGGPAADFLPEVARKLGMSLVLPDYADTANALGALMALVVQRVTVTVTQPKLGKSCVFYGAEPKTFKSLDAALEHARTTALAAASKQALSSGAESVTTELEESREHVDHDIDGELFLSASIMAIASGRPMRS